ncbi:MAG: alkaline phosphatase D family protein [Nitrospira sp.]|nr:alkaline phosphatase D family protein [Nitrospira sp.]
MHRVWFLLPVCLLAVGHISCVSPSREGLPPNSPFGNAVVLATDLLPQGIGVGDVSATSALLWVRTDGPATVQVEWATPAMWDMASKLATAMAPVPRTAELTSTADTDYTLSIPLAGLTPATRYRYHVLIARDGKTPHSSKLRLAARGEWTTLPDVGTSAPVTFAWSADLGGQGRCRQGPEGYPIFDVMQRQNLDFFLFLGDTIYSDDSCPAPPNEPGADFVATTLDEYRARHRYQRGAAALRRFLESVPVYVTWDDHEVRNDFSGPFDPRMPAGRQALREYWPISTHADEPHRLYRSVRYGADLELFILDTRQYRSRDTDLDGPVKTMLGAAQLKWLLDGLGNSTAIWRVIATSVPLSVPKGGAGYSDGWAAGPNAPGFERERQVLVDAIVQRRMKNVVFLGGDVHYVQANAYDPNRDGTIDFHEFVAGPLSARPGRQTPASDTLHPTRLVNEGGYQNFGLIRITKTSLEVMVVDETGGTRFTHRITAR